MNKLLFSTALLILSLGAWATPTPITPCTPAQLTQLEESIGTWSMEGHSNVSYMLNTNGEKLGFYAWSSEVGMYAEICEYLSDGDLTAADQWYYWDEEGSTNPAKWETGVSYQISQDEGIASFKVLESSSNGEVKAQFDVTGWDDSSEDQIVRSDIVIFQKK